MAHYPLYTQNLSLVGVCVKRIGKEDSKHDPFSSDERCLLSALDDLARLIETDGWAATDGQAA